MAPGLKRVQEAHASVQMGSYPYFEKNKLGTNLVLRCTDAAQLDEAHNALWQMLESDGFAANAKDVPPETPDGGSTETG